MHIKPAKTFGSNVSQTNETNNIKKTSNETEEINLDIFFENKISEVKDEIKQYLNDNEIFNDFYNKLKEFNNYILNLLKGDENDSIKWYDQFDCSNISKDGFKIQGVTEVDGKYFISAYNSKKCSCKDDKHKSECMSRIYIYNKSGICEGKIILDNRAHVGGISYDKNNEILFVSGSKGRVNAYNYELIKDGINKILEDEELDIDNVCFDLNDGIYEDIHINNGQKVMEDTIKCKTSTLYYGNYLYAATFDPTSKGEMVKFEVVYNEANNEIEYKQIDKIEIPTQVQGIAITEYNDKKYLVISQSIGFIKSNVLLYELIEEDDNDGDNDYDDGKLKKKYLGKYYEDISGLEGVQINDKGSVVFVSERHEESIVTSMDEIISKVEKKDDDIQEGLAAVGGWVYDITH